MTKTAAPKTGADKDQATDVPNVSIRKIRGQKYVVWWNVQQTTPSIRDLASWHALQPEQVLDALLSYQQNLPVVKPLWEANGWVGGYDADPDNPPRYPGAQQARIDLKKAAKLSYTADANFNAVLAYTGWTIDGSVKAVLLPYSAGFEKVLAAATAEKEKQAELAALASPLKALEDEIKDLQAGAWALGKFVGWFNDGIKKAAQEVAILEALDGLLGLCLKYPKSDVGDKDRKFAEDLRDSLATLKQQAHHYMLVEPQDDLAQSNLKGVRDGSADLMKRIEDPDFVSNVAQAVDHVDLVDHWVWTDLNKTLQAVGLVLLRSDKAEEFIDKHLGPMIAELASRADLSSVSVPNLPELEAALKAAVASPSSTSVYRKIATVAGTAEVAGNLSGPTILSLVLIRAAVPVIAQKSANSTKDAASFSSRLFKALTTLSKLETAEVGILAEAANEGDLGKISQIKWGNKILASEGWSAAIAIANAIVLYAVFTDPRANHADRVAAVFSTAPGSLSAVAKVASRYLEFLKEGIYKVGTDVLGMISGVITLVMGYEAALKAYDAHDNVEIGVGAATATAGAALAVGSFLVASGTAADATVFGAPVGVVLQVAGVIVLIGAAVVDAIHKYFTSGSLQVFEAFIDRFGQGGDDAGYGGYPWAIQQPNTGTLKSAFENVKSAEHHIWRDLWKCSAEALPFLRDLGFSEDQAKLITGASLSAIDKVYFA